MINEKTYTADEICELLNISKFTFQHWYDLQSKQIRDGLITEKYLPEPIRLEGMRGKPRRWTDKMVNTLRKYKEGIVIGRNGIYGVYTNPNYKNTKKYKNPVSSIDNE